MSTDKLHDAMNYIDDDLIETVDSLRKKKQKKKGRILRIMPAVAAACVCVILCSAIFYFGKIYETTTYNSVTLSDVMKGDSEQEDCDSNDIQDGSNDLICATAAPDEEPGNSDTEATSPPEYEDNAGVPNEDEPSNYPQTEPSMTGKPSCGIDLPSYTIYVEIVVLQNDGFMCRVIDSNGVTGIYDGGTLEIVYENHAGVDETQLSEGEWVYVTFCEYDKKGRIIAENIESESTE